MSKKTNTVLLIVFFALIIAMSAFLYNELTREYAPDQDLIQIGAETKEGKGNLKKAEDFMVVNIDGKYVKLSDMLGRPVVVNFWASWCSPCKKEMPEFNKVYEEYGTAVAFMMVDLVDGNRETREKGLEFITSRGYRFPVYFDMYQEAAKAYGITSIPMTLFIDKDGYIVTKAIGVIDEDTLKKGIELIRK